MGGDVFSLKVYGTPEKARDLCHEAALKFLEHLEAGGSGDREETDVVGGCDDDMEGTAGVEGFRVSSGKRKARTQVQSH